MQVSRIMLGVYANQQPFCLYLFPWENFMSSLEQNSSSQMISTIKGTQKPFYRLRDIDRIFFESSVGYIYNSGKIPQKFFATEGSCFYEESGDIYLSANALSNTATRLGNHLLAEFCKLSKLEILSGMADCLLNSVSITRVPFIEGEFEFIASNSKSKSLSPLESFTPAPKEDCTNSNHKFLPSDRLNPPALGNIRKRMSVEEVLDNCNSSNEQIYGSKVASPVEPIASPNRSDRGEILIKQEPSTSYLGSDNSKPVSPKNFPRSSHSPFSPHEATADLSALIDDDSRMRKRRRCAVSTITSNSIKVTNDPEVMEKVRSTLKLKEQQKAIIEARQQAQQQQNGVDRKNLGSSSATLPKRPTHQRSRNNRNSRNLSVFAPPYNAQNLISTSGSPHDSLSPNTSNLKRNSSITTPISPTIANKSRTRVNGTDNGLSNSDFGYHPAHRTHSLHSASTNASINGLISPQNVEFRPFGGSRSSSYMAKSHELTHADRINKESFINTFDSFYDTLAESRNLKSTLNDQIRKTSTLLQTLQTSGTMIESLVHSHFRDMQREVVKDLMTLEKRITKIEGEMKNSTVVRMSLSPPLEHDGGLSDIHTNSHNMGYPHRSTAESVSGSSSSGSPYARHIHLSSAGAFSPPLSATSLNEGEDKSYFDVLSTLKARLESLERRMSVP
ncbi:hypothetical protein G9A89_015849 [Geosiphon pyriformis]|nr:hypothetical protein G9A89_015849 [Geosiphon pyriformis]